MCAYLGWRGEGSGGDSAVHSSVSLKLWSGRLSAGLELSSLNSVAERLMKPTSGWGQLLDSCWRPGPSLAEECGL